MGEGGAVMGVTSRGGVQKPYGWDGLEWGTGSFQQFGLHLEVWVEVGACHQLVFLLCPMAWSMLCMG